MVQIIKNEISLIFIFGFFILSSLRSATNSVLSLSFSFSLSLSLSTWSHTSDSYFASHIHSHEHLGKNN